MAFSTSPVRLSHLLPLVSTHLKGPLLSPSPHQYQVTFCLYRFGSDMFQIILIYEDLSCAYVESLCVYDVCVCLCVIMWAHTHGSTLVEVLCLWCWSWPSVKQVLGSPIVTTVCTRLGGIQASRILPSPILSQTPYRCTLSLPDRREFQGLHTCTSIFTYCAITSAP